MLKADDIKRLLIYDPSSGHFAWNVRRRNRRIGTRAGFVQSRGYIQIRVQGSFYLAHRLAWLYMTGNWPVAVIDHIDGDVTNNRWENLRSATQSQNLANSRKQRASRGRPCSSPLKGVSLCKATERWRADIRVGNKQVWLGRFDSQEEAHAAYVRAAKRAHGDYARTS